MNPSIPKTKEEMLAKMQKFDAYYCSEPVFSESEVKIAMDEYAKQMAIEFAVHYAQGHVGWLREHRKQPDPDYIISDRLDTRYDHFVEEQQKASSP